MTDTAQTAADPRAQDPQTQWARFRERRAESVVQPQGFLALTTTQWVTGTAEEPETIWGVPGRWATRPAGESGLRVFADASDGIRVDGELVDGEAVARGKDDANPSRIVFSETVTGTVVHGEAGYALRVWDAESDAVRGFGSIDAFDYNPDWVVEARFSPSREGATVEFGHVKEEGRTRALEVPGEFSFTKDGVEYRLAAIPSGRALQIVFSDATSGDSTYSVGRFLFVAPRPDGSVTLDFNLAVLPPCAFSYAFNCPMPPAQNRFAVPIEAGEKNVLAKDGSLLHA